MIAKSKTSTQSGRFGEAGDAAEQQMAFYLNREFGAQERIQLFHDLRIVHEGEVAQIDHLVIYRFCMFIVESKSVSGKVSVNKHGEWARHWKDKVEGMPSPVLQAKRQGELLLNLLEAHADQLLTKVLGLQCHFGGCPLETLVAVSDRGIIERNGMDPPELCKADQVCDRIWEVVLRHRRAARRLSIKYGSYRFNQKEFDRIVRFLLEQHTPLTADSTDPPARKETVALPRPAAPQPTTSAQQPRRQKEPPKKAVPSQRATKHPVAQMPAANGSFKQSPTAAEKRPACKHCKSRSLFVTYGRWGYYFKCHDCAGNTPIDYTCRECGKKGGVSKKGLLFYRVCTVCEHKEQVWQNISEP